MIFYKLIQNQKYTNQNIIKKFVIYHTLLHPLGEFVDNYEESDEFILQKNLYKEYSVWCVEMLKEAVSTKKFTDYIIQLKVKVKTDHKHGNKIFLKRKI
jgi:hypothetical protein